MKDTLPNRVRFGGFELDLKIGELYKDEQTTLLQEQPLQVLRMLVLNAGKLVTREEIQKKLWPNDTMVEFDHGINTAIQKLRRALGDSADKPSYIQTVARRGYRLIARVEGIDSSCSDEPPAEAISSGEDETAPGLKLESSSLTGNTVSHYRVLDVIGGGGMGVVYRGEDIKLGRRVAIKFLPEDLGSDAQALERFSREARAASSLDHPNICQIYEFGEHDGRPFIVMQLLEGQTLSDRLAAAAANQKVFPLAEVLDVGTQVIEGLKAAHEKGIIHRDIKPANIFLTNKGVCKILDFGLAKLLSGGSEYDAAGQLETSPAASPSASTAVSLTRTGKAIGTAGYMSPEQVRGELLDARTDLFSFGLVLYEMATGRRAFTGNTLESLHEAILNRTPTPPTELNPDLPLNVQEVIQKCLERDRNLRYQWATEVLSDLEKIKREKQQPYLRRHWVLFATATLVTIALIASGLYYRSRHATTRLTDKDTTLASCVGECQEIIGDWQGMPKGNIKLRMILHISNDRDGNLKASMDSPDQGVFGIPVSSISLKNSILNFEIARIQGSYEGKLNGDASKISGSWHQIGFLDLDFQRIGQPNPASPSDIDGAWMGAIEGDGIKLRIVLHINNTAYGLTATMDSPDQGARGIPVTTVTRKGSILRIEMQTIGGTFQGTINADVTTIKGKWTQSGYSWPLVLRRAEDGATSGANPLPISSPTSKKAGLSA